MVQKLKLNFATSDDYNRIKEFLASKEKNSADPSGYISVRKSEYLKHSVDTRAVAFITDIATDEIVYFTSTYKIYDGDINPNEQHLYTEVGTSIALLTGFGFTPFVSSLLALKEWLFNPPKRFMLSRIREGNKAAIVTRSKIIGWNIMQDEEIIKDAINHCCKSCENLSEDAGKDMLCFYMVGEGLLQKMANLALRVIDRGAVMNKEGDIKPIDFSVINEVGITENRLRAIARGEENRDKILAIK